MATTGHCAYCFEVLVADLENRKPLSYRQVQDSWEQYQLLGKPKADGHEAAVLEDGDEPDDEDGEMDGVEEEEDEQEADGMQEQKQPPSTLQLPSISRLQAPSSGPPSSSSSSLSTPSSHATSKSSSATSFFSTTPRSKQPSPTAPPKEEPPHPLFITWSTLSPHHQKSLRGCIGTFDPQPLPTGLKSYALTAAFEDTRFPPISRPELPTLHCSTTLLTNFTPCATPLDWTLGTHGIRIAFTHGTRRLGATYLPDVAVEQGWTKEETVRSLMRKAGAGGKGGWRDVKGGVECVRYEGEKASLGWGEWRGWREWVGGEVGS